MPKILVSLADARERETVCAALRLGGRHSVAATEAGGPLDENPKKFAERLVGEKAAVAILDYVQDDAFSVKALQAATDYASMPRFIFILPEGVPVSHILMAVNEGASALLERPVNVEALGNYVERAINGPARFRYEVGREADMAKSYAEMEREAKSMKVRLAANRKLISFLMSTPAANQSRSALVVSDSAYQRDYLRKLLEEHGFQVLTAGGPEEGTKTALEERPRLVISDLEMEGKNGVEFCRDLKINHKFMPCFFVICTANSEKADVVMAPGNGVDACVVKPSNESGDQELIASAAMGLLL